MAEETNQDSGAKKRTRRIVEIEPPDLTFYSSVANVRISEWDIRINFADSDSVRDSSEEKIKAKVGVIMSPDHAAALAMLLLRQVQAFEMQNGPIRYRPWASRRMRGEKRIGELVSKLPFDPEDVESVEIKESDNDRPTEVLLTLKGGTERTLKGEEISDHVVEFLTIMKGVTEMFS